MSIDQKAIIIGQNNYKSVEISDKVRKRIDAFLSLMVDLVSNDTLSFYEGSMFETNGLTPNRHTNSLVSFFLTDEPDVILYLRYMYPYYHYGATMSKETRPSQLVLTLNSLALERVLSIEEFLEFYSDSLFAKKIIFNLDLLKSDN